MHYQYFILSLANCFRVANKRQLYSCHISIFIVTYLAVCMHVYNELYTCMTFTTAIAKLTIARSYACMYSYISSDHVHALDLYSYRGASYVHCMVKHRMHACIYLPIYYSNSIAVHWNVHAHMQLQLAIYRECEYTIYIAMQNSYIYIH